MTTTVVAAAFGGPEVLSVVDEPLGDFGVGNVRVAVKAVGVNPADYKVYSGEFGRDVSQLPIHLGFEAAGVVVATGEEAEGPAGPIRAGDEVILYRVPSAYAGELIVPTASVVPKPAALSFEEASGLMVAGATATHALASTEVERGDTVLIHGASGGVGSWRCSLP